MTYGESDPWNALSNAIISKKDPKEKNYWVDLIGKHPEKMEDGYQYKIGKNFPFQYVDK